MSMTLIQDRVRDTRFGPEPTTPAQVIEQARALLAEEGRWLQGYAFKSSDDRDPGTDYTPDAVDPNAPLCGSWGVCAIGAVALVTGDMALVERVSWENTKVIRLVTRDSVGDGNGMSQLYKDTTDLLDKVAKGVPHPDERARDEGYDFASIVDLNDTVATRQDVLDAFDEAYNLALAGDRELVTV